MDGKRVVDYAETRRGIEVIPPASFYGRVDRLNSGDVVRFDGYDWIVLNVIPVHRDKGMVVIATTAIAGKDVRRALLFPHPAAAALVVIL